MPLFILLIASFWAHNIQAEPSRLSVMPLLEGFEWTLPRAEFNALPNDTYLTLIEIAGDKDTLAFYRGRALVALGLYENKAVWTFFEGAIKTPMTKVEKRRSLEGMCKIFSKSRLSEIKVLLRPGLHDGDAHFRLGAAQCLASLQERQFDVETKIALDEYEKRIIEDWEYKKYSQKRK